MSLSGPMCQRLCRPAQFGVGLGAREMRVKLVSLALSARETRVKPPWPSPTTTQPHPQRRNQAHNDAPRPATPWHRPQTLPLPRSRV